LKGGNLVVFRGLKPIYVNYGFYTVQSLIVLDFSLAEKNESFVSKRASYIVYGK